jgi:hypothetical protein
MNKLMKKICLRDEFNNNSLALFSLDDSFGVSVTGSELNTGEFSVGGFSSSTIAAAAAVFVDSATASSTFAVEDSKNCIINYLNAKL